MNDKHELFKAAISKKVHLHFREAKTLRPIFYILNDLVRALHKQHKHLWRVVFANTRSHNKASGVSEQHRTSGNLLWKWVYKKRSSIFYILLNGIASPNLSLPQEYCSDKQQTALQQFKDKTICFVSDQRIIIFFFGMLCETASHHTREKMYRWSNKGNFRWWEKK